MQKYDLVFLHAPKSFDTFRPKPNSIIEKEILEKKADPMFCFIPMGVFALADILDKKGYNVKIINLGIEKQLSKSFNLRDFVKSVISDIYAIDLHWVVHSASAIQLAEICKKNHPESLVILGGMTATWFSKSIIRQFPFIDAIILGEADVSLPKLVENQASSKSFESIDGLEYRKKDKIMMNPIKKVIKSLNNLDYTNVSLMKNGNYYFSNDVMGCGRSKQKIFWLPIARSCPYNCIHCGGSQYAYKKFSGRENFITRSPEKIASDILKLSEQGVEYINFSHDPRIGGKEYINEIANEIHKTDVNISAYIETFTLPDKKFIETLSRCFSKIVLALTPESINEKVRYTAGRKFSNNEFFKSLSKTKKMSQVETQIYFTIGLPGERFEKNIFNKYQKFIEKVNSYNGKVIPSSVYTIDPNCLMALYPERYGVKLHLQKFQDYQRICYSLNPLDWVGHETKHLSRDDILRFTQAVQFQAYNTLLKKHSEKQVGD